MSTSIKKRTKHCVRTVGKYICNSPKGCKQHYRKKNKGGSQRREKNPRIYSIDITIMKEVVKVCGSEHFLSGLTEAFYLLF